MKKTPSKPIPSTPELLGMAVAKSKKALTHSLIRTVLLRITHKANRDARKAMKQN